MSEGGDPDVFSRKREPSGSSTSSRGRLIVLSGPSGVGKDTLVRRLRERHPEVWLSISRTTRKPRPKTKDAPEELHGREYFFLTREEFEAIPRDDWLEFAEYGGNLYGTPRKPLGKRLDAGETAVLVINIEGARSVREALREKLPDVEPHFVFLSPPSHDELVGRLTGRYEEELASMPEGLEKDHRRREIYENEIPARLARAEEELALRGQPPFEKTIVNDDVDRAVEELVGYLNDASVHLSSMLTAPREQAACLQASIHVNSTRKR